MAGPYVPVAPASYQNKEPHQDTAQPRHAQTLTPLAMWLPYALRFFLGPQRPLTPQVKKLPSLYSSLDFRPFSPNDSQAFFKKMHTYRAILMYNPHTLATCTVEWFLVYSELCNHHQFQTIFITLKRNIKPISSHDSHSCQ